MPCPCCRRPLPDEAAACPHCEFSLASAGQYFGELPRLESPLSDLTGALGFWKKRAVRDALLRMSQVFPQLRFAAVLADPPPGVPLAAHAFWLFNQGGLCAAQESGGQCRLVLTVLDVRNARAACMIGYGLDPFVQQDPLDRIATAAAMTLQTGDPAAAVLKALEAARTEFADACRANPRQTSRVDAPQSAAAGSATAYAY